MRKIIASATITCLLIFVGSIAYGGIIDIERVSIGSTGQEANDRSGNGTISANGRYIAFASSANNLTPSMPPNPSAFWNIYRHDRQTGQTQLLSKSSANIAANGTALAPDISGNGDIVVFESFATNLVPGVTNGYGDIYAHDITTGITELISSGLTGNGMLNGDGGGGQPSISEDGRYVAFLTSSPLTIIDTNQINDVYVYDRAMDTIKLVSIATDGSLQSGFFGASSPIISGNGQYIAFTTYSSFTSNDPGGQDVYVHDQFSGITELVSVQIDGQASASSVTGVSISADGINIAFASNSPNLVNNDINNAWDVFVRNMITGAMTLVTKNSMGVQANDWGSWAPTISADGNVVAFASDATNLVANDTNSLRDVFIHNLTTGVTERISVKADGTEGNDVSWPKEFSADGKYLSISSTASNLVPNDSNSETDVFVIELDIPVVASPNKVYLPIIIKQ